MNPETSIQHKISLIDFRATKVDFTCIQEPNENERVAKFNLHLKDERSKDNPNIFSKVFVVSLNIFAQNINVALKIDVEYITNFECDNAVTDEFLKSDFVKISAPAIGFPYVRSFITNITVQVGYTPIILPAINFVQFAQENK